MPYTNARKADSFVTCSVTISSFTSGYADAGNTDDTDQDFTTTGGAADNEWMARKFTAVNTGKVQYAKLTLALTGAPAGTITASIFSDDGGGTSLPSAITGSASTGITSTTLVASPGGNIEFNWDFDGPDIVSGTDYWLVLKTVGYTYTNGITEVIWRTDANGALGLNECAKYDSNAGTPWSTMGANVGADLEIGSSANWEITADESGDALPNRLDVRAFDVMPTASTVWDVRTFSKSTRLLSDEIKFLSNWFDGEAASDRAVDLAALPKLLLQPWGYRNRDISNKIMGSVRIKPGEADSGFEIVVDWL